MKTSIPVPGQRYSWPLLLALLFASLLTNFSCSKSEDGPGAADVTEVAQQVGDVMASIDEFGGGSSSLAMMTSEYKALVQYEPFQKESPILSLLEEKAQAAYCSASTFSTCTANRITRTFNGCTVGNAKFDGTVVLDWVDGAANNVCAVTTAGHNITRNPGFQITGRRGGVLTVQKTGSVGQRLTFDGVNAFAFTNDGVRRTISVNSETLFDYSTTTLTPITVTGLDRANRSLSGGSLRITNHLTSVTCDITPSAMAWTSTCTCPTSGTWTGTCSDSKTFTLAAQSTCGSATLTLGSASPQNLTFDRCSTP